MVLVEQATRPRVATRSRRLVIAVAGVALLAVAVALGLVVLQHRTTTPRLFGDSTGTYLTGSVAVGQSFYADAGVDPGVDSGRAASSATLEVVQVQPLLETNTADASVTLVMCPTSTSRTGILMGAPGRCGDRILQPGTLRLGPAVQVVLAVTPRHPGDVTVTGVDITYRQAGKAARHQVIGLGARVHAVPAGR